MLLFQFLNKLSTTKNCHQRRQVFLRPTWAARCSQLHNSLTPNFANSNTHAVALQVLKMIFNYLLYTVPDNSMVKRVVIGFYKEMKWLHQNYIVMRFILYITRALVMVTWDPQTKQACVNWLPQLPVQKSILAWNQLQSFSTTRQYIGFQKEIISQMRNDENDAISIQVNIISSNVTIL